MRKFTTILASMLLVGVLLTACKNEKKPENKTEKKTETPPPAQEKPVETPIDTVEVIDQTEIQAIKAENNLKKDEYYVIGGSFKEVKRAQHFDGLLKKKNYESLVLKPYKGFNRVAIQAYENEANARIALAKLRKEFNDVSFWLLVPDQK